MSSKWLALTAIGTQLILGLVLVAILITLQHPASPSVQTGPIHVVVDTTPAPCTDMFGCGNRADPHVYGLP
jgi:hypothetical protein